MWLLEHWQPGLYSPRQETEGVFSGTVDQPQRKVLMPRTNGNPQDLPALPYNEALVDKPHLTIQSFYQLLMAPLINR